MAGSLSLNCKFFILTQISIVVFCCYSGYAVEDNNPDEIVTQALLCFNNKFIYSSCDEAYRLGQSGYINVPQDETDQFCNGPCLAETQLLLNCIDNVLGSFLFYNKATIPDIRDTLHAGCSYTSQRGNFNVEGYMQGETSNAERLIPNPIRFYAFVLIGGSLFSLLYHP